MAAAALWSDRESRGGESSGGKARGLGRRNLEGRGLERRDLFPMLAIAALALGRFAAYRSFEPDDLYIYLQFVRNLLGRGELAFNAGEPTYGFTSPLWLFALAAATAVLRDPFLAAKLCSVAASLAAPLLLYALALRLTGRRSVAFLAGLVFAWDAWLVRWSMSGLEGGLSAAIPTASLLLYLRARDRDRAPWGAALLAGLAPLVRPELVGWWLLLAAHHAATSGGGMRRRVMNGAAALLPGLITAGGFACYALHAFGRALPNTAEAKGAILPALAGAVPASLRIVQLLASTAAVELAAWGAGLILFLKRGGLRRLVNERDPDGIALAVAWSVGLMALYGVRGVTVYSRYLLMLLPFVVLGGFVAAAPLWLRGGAWRRSVLAVASIILAQNLLLDRLLILPATRNYQMSEREVNLWIGSWLRDQTDPEAVVAALDIGAIGYVSGRRILDMNGLVTPQLIPFKREGRVGDYLVRNRPDFVVDVDADPEHLAKSVPALDPRLVLSRPFYNMFLFQKGALYYSLYAVGPRRREGPKD
jgi:hypothetical protein